jgi:hypothetical protein
MDNELKPSDIFEKALRLLTSHAWASRDEIIALSNAYYQAEDRRPEPPRREVSGKTEPCGHDQDYSAAYGFCVECLRESREAEVDAEVYRQKCAAKDAELARLLGVVEAAKYMETVLSDFMDALIQHTCVVHPDQAREQNWWELRCKGRDAKAKFRAMLAALPSPAEGGDRCEVCGDLEDVGHSQCAKEFSPAAPYDAKAGEL